MEPRDVQERWVDRREEFDELERKQWEEEGKAERGEALESEKDDGVSREQRHVNQQDSQDEDSDEEMRQLKNMPMRDSGIKIVRKDS